MANDGRWQLRQDLSSRTRRSEHSNKSHGTSLRISVIPRYQIVVEPEDCLAISIILYCTILGPIGPSYCPCCKALRQLDLLDLTD